MLNLLKPQNCCLATNFESYNYALIDVLSKQKPNLTSYRPEPFNLYFYRVPKRFEDCFLIFTCLNCMVIPPIEIEGITSSLCCTVR